jgi:para-nitrobenzyl esterase
LPHRRSRGSFSPATSRWGSRPTLDADQAVLAGTLIDQFSAFARDGNPTTTGAPLWPQFTSRTGDLVMSLQPAGDSELTSADAIAFDHNCAFWNNLGGQPQPHRHG